jgi:hypothetical protein
MPGSLTPFQDLDPPILFLALGLVLLVAGRKLFWLLVGAAGFLFAWSYAESWEAGWLLALLAGVLGALLAVFLQRFAIGLAGFLVGGALLASLVELEPPFGDGTIFIVGGILAAILAVMLFEAALVGVSAVFGAGLIVGALPLEGSAATVALLALAALGVAVQAGWTRASRAREARA